MNLLILIVSVLLSLAAAATGARCQHPVVPATGVSAAPSVTPSPSPAPPAPYDVLAGGGPT